MATQIEKHVITLEEFERMVEAGVFAEDAHIELIRGEIVEMTPIGVPHAGCVARLNTRLVRQVGEAAIVWPQNNPIGLVGNSRPEPDLTLVRWRQDWYTMKLPTAEDVLLVVEVADSSLKYDRSVKGALYAEAGIPVYWIVNLPDAVIEVYTDPMGEAYRQTQTARRGDSLALPAALGGAIAVDDILGSPGDRPGNSPQD